MAFASKYFGMLYLASSTALVAAGASTGCIATDTIEFVPVQNFPPSIISQALAKFPLNEIGAIDLDEPVEAPEMPLEVSIRDPNFDQTLDYRLFLDAPEPPAAEKPIQEGVIDPTGFVDRPRTFTISYDELAPGKCHKIELLVAGEFASNTEQRRPVEEGDIDGVTWWVRVTDSGQPISEECR